MLTAADLRQLLLTLRQRGSELDDIEAKAARGGTPRIFETLSSFANRRGGGLVVLGIDDDSLEAVGVRDADQLQRDVASIAAQMEPPLRLQIQALDLDDKLLVIIEVPEVDPGQKPCYYRPAGLHGGAYVRVGDGDRRMTDYEIYSLMSSRGPVNDDRQAVRGGSVSDLDHDAVTQYLTRLRAAKPEAKYLHGRREQVLRTLGILVPDAPVAVPTLAGLLAFGRFPQQFYPGLVLTLTSVGSDVTDNRFADNYKAEGNIVEILNQAMGWLNRNLKHRMLVTGLLHQEIPEYPMDALREAIVNAVVHRDYGPYAVGSQVQVRLCPDRIEIRNPGGLYGQVSVDRLGEPGLQSTRNPLLARFLEDLGPMENRGSGIATMLHSLRLAHLEPPQFEDQRTSFRVAFFSHTLLDQETLEWLNRFAGHGDLNDRQRYALAYLHNRRQLANRDYQLLNAVDPRTAARDLRALVSMGLIESLGTRGGTYYRLAQAHLVSETRATYRTSPRRLHAAQQAVLTIIDEHGPIGTAEIASRLSLGRSTANYQIKRLLDAGLIEATESRPQSGRQAYVVADAGARLTLRPD